MKTRSIILDIIYPSVLSADHNYDNYEGFDAYQISTMPVYDYASVIGLNKKEIIYQ